MTGVVAYPRDLPDHPGHPRQRPQFGGKAVGHRPLPQGLIQKSQIRLLQPRLAAGPARLPQGRRTTSPPGVIPTMHTHRADLQPAGNLGLVQPAKGKKPRGLLPPRFKAVKVSTGPKGLAHTASLFLHTFAIGPNLYYIIRDSISARPGCRRGSGFPRRNEAATIHGGSGPR